ncbi:MAG TPA: hypothetical protein VHH11_13935 [Gammaproteobacteria bacterium]|nr:hypothetical protein [Gammaproteobacteria bacterium]
MEQLGRAQRRAFIEDAVRLRSLRPQVRAFAEAMEAQLRANDHKGGWQECSLAYLYGRVAEELEELSAETDRAERDTAAVRREAADVAAFVMMIADVCGALTEPRNG